MESNISSFNVETNEFPFNSTKTDKLKILNLNIGNMHRNFVNLLAFLDEINFQVDIIILTETWLDNESVKLYNLPGYKKSFINRPTRGGGILAFIGNSIKFETKMDLSGILCTHEALVLNINPGQKNSINIYCIYRPPCNDLKAFTLFMKNMKILKKRVILVGDINLCPFRNSKSTNWIDLNNLLQGKSFSQLINFPTFLSYLQNPSTIDHVWSNLKVPTLSYVFKTPVSDHIPSLCIFDTTCRQKVMVRFRNFSNDEIAKFNKHIKYEIRILSDKINCAKTIDEKFEVLSDGLEAMCSKYFPIKTKYVSYVNSKKPWIDKSLKSLIAHKHKLAKLDREGKISHRVFLDFSRFVRNKLSIAENAHFRRQLFKNRKCMRKKWKFINNILGKESDHSINEVIIENKPVSDKTVIAHNLNLLYKQLPIDLQKRLPTSNTDF